MLARVNRLVSANDYRTVLRTGRRTSIAHGVVSIVRTTSDAPARFGFIVTRKVGNAVNRNLVRRRMRAIARELVDAGMAGVDVVVRASPASSTTSWASLRAEFGSAMSGRP